MMAVHSSGNLDEFGYRKLDVQDVGWTEKYEHLDTDDEILLPPRNRSYYGNCEHVDTDDELFFPSEEVYRRKTQVWAEQRSASSRASATREAQTMPSDVAGDSTSSTTAARSGVEGRIHGASRDHTETAPSRSRQGPPSVPDQLAQTANGSDTSHTVRDVRVFMSLLHRYGATLNSRDFWRSTVSGHAAYFEDDLEDIYSDGSLSEWDGSNSDESDDDDDDLFDLFEPLAIIDLGVDCPLVEDGETSTCTICLDECPGPNGRARVVAKCRHRFHAECLETWLKRRDQCPNCRSHVSQLRR
jgi:hypothetical protein